MPLSLQDRLFRTLEEYSISRFGGGDSVVHSRVIAASKTRLEERVTAGGFREDLLARLAVLRIELPPLRERDDDVRLIAEHMLAEATRLQGVPRRQLGLDAVAVLRSHRWPGNVRELKHVIERALVVAEGPLIGAEHLVINQRRAGAGAVRGAATFGEIRIPADGKRLRDIEKEALELTLQLTDFNQSAAARILCISRPTLARKLRAYGLSGGRVDG
jgi:DNA-binding NtrC family response regulator